MALHESVLEEFGLAPLWVRRGMSAAQEPVGEAGGEQGADALANQKAHRDDPRVAAREASSAALAQDGRDDAQIAMQTGEARQADSAQIQGERLAPSAQEQQRRVQAPVEARQPSQPPRTPEPPAFDGPPDDDFAWFDDQPAHAPAEARREAPEPSSIQTLDWDALSEQVAACERCRLCEKRTNTVFGVGDRNADWMLIGEAPGENEDRLGEPFVGQAGKLLDNMLRSLMLARDSNVYIANVIKCRPPGNRNPEPDEVARCEPYLQRQVALVKPKLIVALGRFAAQSLLRTEASISSLRGRVHEYEGVPVIVTYHPAYLLRSLPDKAKAWADLCLARDTWLAAGGVPSNAAK
ncbi:uracil-DNA glycosylase family protein [Paraburkholderia metrosideri]|uniref:Type-4 uracil-DNA glycosylase n=1 Tax=Paraburkholderia metrosideri TaxID=580937 RepID=A0ABW9DQW6_9BURK